MSDQAQQAAGALLQTRSSRRDLAVSFLDDPKDMTPEARLGEVAAILAAGYLRLRRSATQLAPVAGSPPFTEKPLDSSGEPLPLCAEGLTGRDPTLAEVAP